MADTVGNRLGSRAAFDYETDDGESVLMVQDESVGEAVGNVKATTPQRATSVNSKYLRGRYILVQSKTDPDVKKKIVIGDPTNTLYASDSSSEVTINGVVFVTTGRVGEAVTFLRVDGEATPPA